jgi:hypothetical protein
MLPVGGGAQELEAKWLVGKWVGTTTDGSGRYEVTFKEDGTFEGDSQSRFGLTYYRSGKWVVSGDTVSVEYTTDPRPGIPRTKVSWTLKRSGEVLEGKGIRHSDAGQFTFTLHRPK